jgi:hypothetical protein
MLDKYFRTRLLDPLLSVFPPHTEAPPFENFYDANQPISLNSFSFAFFFLLLLLLLQWLVSKIFRKNCQQFASE